jgi:hypothetical protein
LHHPRHTGKIQILMLKVMLTYKNNKDGLFIDFLIDRCMSGEVRVRVKVRGSRGVGGGGSVGVLVLTSTSWKYSSPLITF